MDEWDCRFISIPSVVDRGLLSRREQVRGSKSVSVILKKDHVQDVGANAVTRLLGCGVGNRGWGARILKGNCLLFLATILCWLPLAQGITLRAEAPT